MNKRGRNCGPQAKRCRKNKWEARQKQRGRKLTQNSGKLTEPCRQQQNNHRCTHPKQPHPHDKAHAIIVPFLTASRNKRILTAVPTKIMVGFYIGESLWLKKRQTSRKRRRHHRPKRYWAAASISLKMK